jgi:hypothetical protein
LAEDGIITARDLDSSRAGFLAAEARHNQAVAQVEQARVAERTASVVFQIKCCSFSFLWFWRQVGEVRLNFHYRSSEP